MTKGPERLKLERYLSSARAGQITASALEWAKTQELLRDVATSLDQARPTIRDKFGTKSETGKALDTHFGESAESMRVKAELIRDAQRALQDVSSTITRAKSALTGMKDLGDDPGPWRDPSPAAPGVELTPE